MKAFANTIIVIAAIGLLAVQFGYCTSEPSIAGAWNADVERTMHCRDDRRTFRCVMDNIGVRQDIRLTSQNDRLYVGEMWRESRFSHCITKLAVTAELISEDQFQFSIYDEDGRCDLMKGQRFVDPVYRRIHDSSYSREYGAIEQAYPK